ncbi:MAG: hypothetical protein JW751_24985 [Polyangiaceae bacterium]|nr:hypothetical protein [Polyangiaceae bacterium]
MLPLTTGNTDTATGLMKRTAILLENGARWPEWLDRREPGEVDLLVQRPGEPLLAFARRAIDLVAADPLPPETTYLLTNGEGDERSNLVRRGVLRGLLGRAADTGRGVVVLVAAGSVPQRRALAVLATQLDRELPDTGDVSLRFRSDSALPHAPNRATRRVA